VVGIDQLVAALRTLAISFEGHGEKSEECNEGANLPRKKSSVSCPKAGFIALHILERGVSFAAIGL
jgi:hypothetical protein